MLDEMDPICQPVWPDHTFTVTGPRDASAIAPVTESAIAGGGCYTLPSGIRNEPVRFADEEEETIQMSAPAGGIEMDGSSDSGTSDNPDNPETTDPDVGI